MSSDQWNNKIVQQIYTIVQSVSTQDHSPKQVIKKKYDGTVQWDNLHTRILCNDMIYQDSEDDDLFFVGWMIQIIVWRSIQIIVWWSIQIILWWMIKNLHKIYWLIIDSNYCAMIQNIVWWFKILCDDSKYCVMND